MKRIILAIAVVLSLGAAAHAESDGGDQRFPVSAAVSVPARPAPVSVQAHGKTAVFLWGWFGKQMSAKAERAIAAKGYDVIYHSWLMPPAGCYDAAFGHSNGAVNLAFVCAKKKIAIDPPFTILFVPAPPGSQDFYNPANNLGICCGGYAWPGATNTIVRAPHVQMPNAALPLILKQL